jgi:hypothetical protein
MAEFYCDPLLFNLPIIKEVNTGTENSRIFSSQVDGDCDYPSELYIMGENF